MDASFDGLILFDRHGRVTDANRAASRLLGQALGAMLGERVEDLVTLRQHSTAKSLAARKDLPELDGTVWTLQRADQSVVSVVIRKTQGSGRQLWVLKDVTRIGPMAEALERKTQLLLEAERVGQMGGFEVDPKTGLVIWTAELQRLMGLPEAAVLTIEETYSFYTEASRAIVREAFNATLSHGTPYDLELEVKTRHGRVFWVREVCHSTFRAGRLVSVVGVMQDITERRQMADLLARSADLERARIGADLHDGVGQELTGLALLLQSIATRSKRESPALSQELSVLCKLASKSIETLRDMSHSMLPVELRQMGFMHVCRQLATSMRKALGVGIRFRFSGDKLQMPAGPTAEHLYRIAQEAIANAVKHGGARQIALTLKASDTKLVLTISDDGSGLEAAPATGGIGLQIMRYRARLLGGLLDVGKNGRGGTRVKCIVPRVGAPARVPGWS